MVLNSQNKGKTNKISKNKNENKTKTKQNKINMIKVTIYLYNHENMALLSGKKCMSHRFHEILRTEPVSRSIPSSQWVT